MSIGKRIQNNRFIKNFTALFSAALLGQIITLIASPILTRIYSPEQFGYFSFYISLCSLLIVYTTGRYEFAINTVKGEEESQDLFKVVTVHSIIFALFITILELFLHSQVIEIFGLEKVSSLVYYIPLTLLSMGLLQGLNYYLNKYKEFGILSKAKVLQSIVTAGSSVVMGLGGLNYLGLVLSNILGLMVSIIYKITSKKLGFLFNFKKYRIPKLLQTAKKHKDYPLFNSTSAFFDNLALQSPVFILMKFFSEAIVGYYSLTVRVLGLPLSLISTTISQVFLSEIAELNRNGHSFRHILKRVMQVLAAIGLIPTIIIIFTGPALFNLAFGEEWRTAGELSVILAFGYYAKFVVAPLSVVFFVTQKVKLLSYIQGIRAVSTLTVLAVSSMLSDIFIVVISYTVHEVIFYTVYLYYIFKVSK